MVKTTPENTVQMSRKINEFGVNPLAFTKLDTRSDDAINIPKMVKLFQNIGMILKKELKNQKKMKLYYM